MERWKRLDAYARGLLNAVQEEVGDASAKGNRGIIREMLCGIEVIGFPFLGENANEIGAIKESAKKTKKTLATILKAASFCVRSSKGSAKAKTAKRLKTKKVR